MTNEPTPRLSGDQILALKFAAHRQLARWSNRPRLSPHQHAQRAALVRAVRILEDKGFTHGCDLQVPSEETWTREDGHKVDAQGGWSER